MVYNKMLDMIDKRIAIIIILVILIIAVYFYRNRGKKETAKGDRGKARSKGKARTKQGRTKNTSDEEGDAPSNVKNADKDLVADARELYGLVHEDLAQGMQLDEFEDLAGDLAGENPEEVYIELRQLYNEAMDGNKDPSKSVTLDHYIKVLDGTD